jgi:hypothetical protein
MTVNQQNDSGKKSAQNAVGNNPVLLSLLCAKPLGFTG